MRIGCVGASSHTGKLGVLNGQQPFQHVKYMWKKRAGFFNAQNFGFSSLDLQIGTGDVDADVSSIDKMKMNTDIGKKGGDPEWGKRGSHRWTKVAKQVLQQD